jgi:hypothetical protein
MSTLLGSKFGVLGHLWSQNDVIMSWLRLTSLLKIIPESILDIYKVFENIDMMSIGIQKQPYPIICPTSLRLWGSGSLVESK